MPGKHKPFKVPKWILHCFRKSMTRMIYHARLASWRRCSVVTKSPGTLNAANWKIAQKNGLHYLGLVFTLNLILIPQWKSPFLSFTLGQSQDHKHRMIFPMQHASQLNFLWQFCDFLVVLLEKILWNFLDRFNAFHHNILQSKTNKVRKGSQKIGVQYTPPDRSNEKIHLADEGLNTS